MLAYKNFTTAFPNTIQQNNSNQNMKTENNKRFRTQWTAYQQRRMEERYLRNNYIETEERDALAEQIGLDTTIVKVYFKNRRAKDKRENQPTQDKPPKRSRPSKRQPKTKGVKKAKAKARRALVQVKTGTKFTFEDFQEFVKANGETVVPEYFGEKYNPKDF